jgi:hypothetical protein
MLVASDCKNAEAAYLCATLSRLNPLTNSAVPPWLTASAVRRHSVAGTLTTSHFGGRLDAAQALARPDADLTAHTRLDAAEGLAGSASTAALAMGAHPADDAGDGGHLRSWDRRAGRPADRRWSSARILLQVAALMLALILAAARGPALSLTRPTP